MAQLGYSGAGAGLSKLGQLLLGFLQQKMQMDASKKQQDTQNDMEKQRIGQGQQTIDLQKIQQQFQQAQTGATNLRAAVGPLGKLDASGVKTMQDAGQGGSVGGSLQSRDLIPAQSPSGETAPGDTPMQGAASVPQLSGMTAGADKPSDYYLKPNFFEDQQMQEAGRAAKKDELTQYLLGKLNPNQQAKALTGVDPTEPDWTTKQGVTQKYNLDTIAAEHKNRMAEIDEQARKALTTGDRQLTQDVLKMWIAEKPDKTLEDADPTVHDKWVQSGMGLLKGLGESNASIKSFINYLDKQGTPGAPADPSLDPTTGLPKKPVSGPASPSGPNIFQRFMAGVKPADGGCVDKAGAYHKDSAECSDKNSPGLSEAQIRALQQR